MFCVFLDLVFFDQCVDQCIQKFLDIARQTECFFPTEKIAVICQETRASYQRGTNCFLNF